MAAATTTTFAGALKQALPDKVIESLSYQGNPALAMLPKDPNFEGDVYRFPIWWGGSQGAIGSVFATVQANKTPTNQSSFNVTTTHKYGFCSIDNELMLAARSNKGAFLRARTAEIEQVITNVANDAGMHIFRNLGGSRGRVGSTSTTTLTLKLAEDVVHFEKDMKIVSDDTDGTAGGAADAEVATLSAVNIDAGTIHRTDANWTASGNFANDDYLFRVTDFGVCMSGFDSWIPSAAPGATAFFGVDRSPDVVRLGGMRYTGTGGIVESLLDASVRLQRLGGRPDVCFMNDTDFIELVKELGSRIQYTSVTAKGTVPLSFRAVELPPVGNGKPVAIMSDRNCQKGVAWLIQLNTWKLVSRNKLPHLLQVRGGEGGSVDSILWEATADAIEVRVGYYANLGCFAPGYNARIALPTVA